MPQCFKPRLIQLKKPIQRTGEFLTHVNVPCGKCVNCIKRRRMEWCFRMEEEMKRSKVTYFVTLTYAPEYLPWDIYGNMVLVPTTMDSKRLHRKVKGLKPVKDKYLKKMKMKDSGWYDNSLQGYLKRLRINQERDKDVTWEMFYNNLNPKKDKVRFFGCGEYGDQFLRPHYHLIIFNASRKHIVESWPFGNVHFTKATKGTIGYVTKYMDKWKDKKQDWKKPSEFNNQSEGIGLGFVEKMKDWYRKNLDINFVVNDGGVRIPMPRYFRSKMFNDDELSMQIFIINSSVNEAKAIKEFKLGIDEYNKRKKSSEKFLEKKFLKSRGKREF